MRQQDVALAIARANPAGGDVSGYVPDGTRSALLEGILASPSSASTERGGGTSTRVRRRVAVGGVSLASLAAIVAGILVLSSGPTAQPAAAAAEILHETAAVAAATDAPAEIPGPGQFLYKRFKRVELESWEPGGESMGGGVMTRPGAFAALMPVTHQEWMGPDGDGRSREIAGTPRFLTSQEEERWEAAGSRLPPPFDPAYQRKYLAHPDELPPGFHEDLEAHRGFIDRESTYTDGSRLKGFRFPDTSRLPTEPEALRHAVESNQIEVSGFNLMDPSAKQLDPGQTGAELLNILQEGYVSTPQLRAAIFNALAELPGIEVDIDATDLLGRRGYSITRGNGDSGSVEYIFDPATSDVLAVREVLGDPEGRPYLKGIPAGTTVRETAYLESGVVDSTQETAAEAEGQAPVARTGPVYRR